MAKSIMKFDFYKMSIKGVTEYSDSMYDEQVDIPYEDVDEVVMITDIGREGLKRMVRIVMNYETAIKRGTFPVYDVMETNDKDTVKLFNAILKRFTVPVLTARVQVLK